MNLLVVDDVATNRKLLRAQLEAEGHTVLEAADGVEALAVLERQPVDAVISDILMPRMDGYRFCLKVRQHHTFSVLPVILYTSTYDSGSDRQLAKTVGADGYVIKPAPTPVILDALHEAIQKAAERRRPQSPQPDEAYVLQEYSGVLVHKLEERNTELQEALKRVQQTHEEILELNRNLEQRVERRSADLAAAKLEAERANRAKSDFLSRMSHDLRTPLNAILGFAQLLEMDLEKAENHESIRHILKGGAHLLGLINEILDIARIESGHLSLSPEPVAIGDIVRHVIELVRPLAAQRGIVFDDDVVTVCGGRHLLADRQRLAQILLNLLSNAVKYNREGGRVRLACEDVPDGRLRIKVSDTGAGIRPEKLQLLFQPFERLGAEQTGIEGTGLGLLLSRGLAEAMGGTLGVESEVDRGSTFWVELALADAADTSATTAAGERAQASSQDPGVTGTVLYIEDNLSNRRLMERLLARRPGVRLVGAAQGQAGLDLVRADRPDLILLDLHLPDMHGEEVLRRLWEDPVTRAIPVAVLSADATPTQVKRLRASGATAYLTKPLDVSEVLRLLDDTLIKRLS